MPKRERQGIKIINALKVFNRLKEKKVFEDYAVGGAIAVSYYVEPRATRDLDIFLLTDEEGYELTWKRLERLGYEHWEDSIIVEGVPVDIVSSNQHPFYEGAIRTSKKIRIGDTSIRIFTPEYLIATKLLVFRNKDKVDIYDLLKYEKIDVAELKDILSGGFAGEEELLIKRFYRILEEEDQS